MIDLEKYGFSLKSDDADYFVYSLVNGEYTVEVHVLNDSYSIDIINSFGHRMNVAQRYTCKTKEHLEFLLFNSSRVGWIIESKQT